MMVRFQSMLTFLVCAIVPLAAVGAQPSSAGPRVRPASMDLVADAPEQAEAGYAEAEGDSGLDCCPVAAECCPLWTVNAGAIFLSRNPARAQPSARVFLAETRQTTPRQIFDMANSGLGTAAGPDITLTRCLGPCWDIEARYFQIDGWNDTNVFRNTTQGTEYVQAYGVSSVAQTSSLAYLSRLYNAELNLRWKRWERFPLLIGFRTLGLDERFQIASIAGNVTTVGVDTLTNNGLYGMQIGTEPVLWDRCGRFRLEGLLKAGIYGNRAHQRTSFPVVGGVLDSRTDGVTSFVGELGLIGVCSLNKYWSLRAGYEVMWITNVALAPDQASSVQLVVPPPPTGTMYDKATAFYYGATASVERKF